MATAPVPHTWLAGIDNATSLNMQTITDSILWDLGLTTSTGTRRPFAIVTQTVAQVGIASGTALTFDAESIDYDNGHVVTAGSNTKYTANTTGLYAVDVQSSLAANTTGTFRALQLKVNGSTVICENNAIFAAGTVPNVIIDLTISTRLALTAGDYVEAIITHNATALNTVVNAGNSRMTVEWRSN